MVDSEKTDTQQPQKTLLRPPSNTRPALWLMEINGRGFVVKDYGSKGFIYRNTIGRFLAWREEKAFRRLRGLNGVPKFYGRLGAFTLIMEAIKGDPVEGLEDIEPLPLHFFEELRGLVRQFHMRGIVHCDLKRAPNILLGEDGRPYVVDWSASITASEFRPFPLNLIYRRFLLDDMNAVVKIQLRHRPDDINPAELALYYRRGPVERFVRRIRDKVRDILQRIA
jgi:hypothetical protein